MNITGSIGSAESHNGVSGAFYNGSNRSGLFHRANNGTVADINFNAANTWTGSTNSTGAHSHTVTVSSTGAMRDDGKVYPTSVSMRWYIKY